MDVTEYQPPQLMDLDQLEDIAFRGGAMPKLRSQAQCVLFQGLRNLYGYARYVNLPREQGKREKAELLENYRINRFLEEVEEQTVQMWKRIEISASDYRKCPSIDAADALLKAIYQVDRKGEKTEKMNEQRIVMPDVDRLHPHPGDER